MIRYIYCLKAGDHRSQNNISNFSNQYLLFAKMSKQTKPQQCIPCLVGPIPPGHCSVLHYAERFYKAAVNRLWVLAVRCTIKTFQPFLCFLCLPRSQSVLIRPPYKGRFEEKNVERYCWKPDLPRRNRVKEL